LALYSENHTVYTNHAGVEVPSATTVLKMLNKPALIHWANYLGFKRQSVDKVLNESAEIGTDFHDMVSKYTMGEPIDGEHYNDAIYLFKVFQKWSEEVEFKPVFSEESLVTEKFGGTIDALCYIEGKLTVLDFKTSKNIYPSMFLQLAAYGILIRDNLPETYEKIEQFGILSNSIKNGVQTKFMSKKDVEKKIFPVFESLVETFHLWFNLNLEEFNENITR